MSPEALDKLQRHSWEPDFSEGEPATDSKICGVCNGEHCPHCKHTLVNNSHGIDQNDMVQQGEDFVHRGSCTYCKLCNPALGVKL